VNKEKVEKKKVLDEVTVLKKKVQELEGKLNAPEDFERYTY
jgi:predicted nuclease with TOPRIM domain